jgi:hypothetical protein
MVAQFPRHKSFSRPDFSSPRHITSFQWQAFENKVNQLMMEPEDFLAHWDCTYSEIAAICKCSRNTVASWFCKGQTGKRPSDAQKAWLGTAHKLLLNSRS